MRMHERALELERQRMRAGVRIVGAVSVGLMICLVIAIQQVQSLRHGIVSSQIMGASFLSDSVGGYVLAAVIAFFAGVTITVVITGNRKRNKDKEKKE